MSPFLPSIEGLANTPPGSCGRKALLGKLELMDKIFEGARPENPEDTESLGFTDGLWDIVAQCWM